MAFALECVGVMDVGEFLLSSGFTRQNLPTWSYPIEGITILVDKKHTMYLIGKAVDFYEGADARGFMLR